MQIRRRAFKELLEHLIPLMLGCLKNPGGGASASSAGDQDPDAYEDSANASPGDATRKGGRKAASDDRGLAGGWDQGEGGPGGEVVVLHYYQQHHQYLLKVAVLETMNR